jgi:hypothetical protein
MDRHDGEGNLQNLAEIGQLDRVEPRAETIGRLRDNAKRLLTDAAVEAISIETRCIAAYTAAHLLSLAALHLRGYAPSKNHGHRAIVFQTLQSAVGADPAIIIPLSSFHQKRNRAEYEGLNEFSTADLEQLKKLCGQVWAKCLAWLNAFRPDLRG